MASMVREVMTASFLVAFISISISPLVKNKLQKRQLLMRSLSGTPKVHPPFHCSSYSVLNSALSLSRTPWDLGQEMLFNYFLSGITNEAPLSTIEDCSALLNRMRYAAMTLAIAAVKLSYKSQISNTHEDIQRTVMCVIGCSPKRNIG